MGVDMTLYEQIQGISNLKEEAMEGALKKWNSIAKPLGSLGRLEEAIIKMAGIYGSSKVSVEKSALIIMCADHGVVEEGVTQTGSEVTKIVADNFTKGNSSVCIMANVAGADVFPVDIGMNTEEHPETKVCPSVLYNPSSLLSPSVLLNKKVAKGSKNIVKQPAMTIEQCEQALQTGINLVGNLKEKGYHIIATGEMGIGNTTPSSALAAVLLNKKVEEVTGRGAGLSNASLEIKIQAIKRAIKRYEESNEKSIMLIKDIVKKSKEESAEHSNDHQNNYSEVMQLLTELGGYDIAGITGVFLGGAIHRIPILIDGFISSVAALIAVAMEPKARNYMFASHESKEPAGKMVLEALKLRPFITCDMYLGEGTGAIAALPLFRMAVEVYNKMSTFQEIKVEQYQEF